MAPTLAPIFVNEDRVRLEGDPKPHVRKIVRASGRAPESVQVFRLKGKDDSTGRPLAMEDLIDRMRESDAVYLRCTSGMPSKQEPREKEAVVAQPVVEPPANPPTGLSPPAPMPPNPEPPGPGPGPATRAAGPRIEGGP